jgi:hypothetical protein
MRHSNKSWIYAFVIGTCVAMVLSELMSTGTWALMIGDALTGVSLIMVVVMLVCVWQAHRMRDNLLLTLALVAAVICLLRSALVH